VKIKKVKEKLKNELGQQSASVLGLKIAKSSISVLTSILLARLLGSKEFGEYTYVWSVLTTTAVIVTFGFPKLIVKSIPAYLVENKWSKIKGIIVSSLILVTSVWACVVTLGFILWLTSLSIYIEKKFVYLSLVSIPLLWLVASLKIERRILHGFKRVVNGEALALIFRPLIFLVAILVVYKTKNGMSASSAVWSQVIAYSLSLLVGVPLIFRREPLKILNKDIEYKWKKWIKTSVPLMGIKVLSMIADRVPILLLGPLVGTEEVGFLKIATQFSNLLTFPLIAVGSVASPMISDYYHRGETKKLQKMIRTCTYGIAVPAIVVALLLLTSSHWLIPAVYGKKFDATVIPLVILSCAYLVHVMYGPVANILNMTGNELMAVKATAYAFVVSVGLSVLLIPVWGIIGAAISGGIAKIVANIFMEKSIIRKVGIRSSIWSIRKAQLS